MESFGDPPLGWGQRSSFGPSRRAHPSDFKWITRSGFYEVASRIVYTNNGRNFLGILQVSHYNIPYNVKNPWWGANDNGI
jgi:hypothetical protein